MKTHGNPDKARTGWTDEETRSLVYLYRMMLAYDARGMLGPKKDQLSKKFLVREWIAANAPHRSHGSCEAKLMNISASCEAEGLPVLRGYKPLRNRAANLDAIVRAIVEAV